MDKVKELQKMINEANNIVVFTGAGVSTDSGLKDFRGKDDLIDTMVNSIVICHDFIRDLYDRSSVSLRELRRFRILFEYLVQSEFVYLILR